MKARIKSTLCAISIPILCMGWVSTAQAKPEPNACIALGALVYDNWTLTDSGGSGLPAGESASDYVRCKSCHGWDRLGTHGGYVRRTRAAERPNAGLGDIDTSSRDIAPGLGNYYHINDNEVLHTEIGRAFEDGSGSWVTLGDNPTAEEVAAYAAGYTLGNQHPDFSTTGANAGDIVLTQDQLDCVVDFVNNADSDPKFYFASIDEDHDPVLYTINAGASSAAGQVFYQQNCQVCHGDPAVDFQGNNAGQPEGGILAYLEKDGRYSEFVHKARWGIPDTIMTRSTIGTPTSQDMIDVMLYLQEFIASDFVVTSGISGTWFDLERSGEGFMIDVAKEGVVAVSFYTYDTMGEQMWIIGAGTVNGDEFVIDFEVTDGGIYGS
ncbi:MAG: cytochrome c, partial [Gammaproteobacteria bacterium]|nr:cytochrome c [Gammaproteobacteria bacterium]